MNPNYYPLISAIIFIIGLVILIIKYGVQKSISAYYYEIPKKQRILFTFFIWSFALTLLIYSFSALVFISVSLICYVGAAPDFESNKTEKRVHLGGVISGILVAFIQIVISGLWQIAIPIVIIAGFFFLMRKVITNYLLYIEIFMFVLIDIGYYIINNYRL